MSLAAACAVGALMLRTFAFPSKPGTPVVADVERAIASAPSNAPQLRGRPPRNLFVACPKLVGTLTARGVAIASPADRAVIEGPFDSPAAKARPVTVETFHLPVISRDGRTAYALVSRRCVGLCGGGDLYGFHLRRGRWVGDGLLQTLWMD